MNEYWLLYVSAMMIVYLVVLLAGAAVCWIAGAVIAKFRGRAKDV